MLVDLIIGAAYLSPYPERNVSMANQSATPSGGISMDLLREGDALLPMHEEQGHIIKLVPTGGMLFQR
jgi:hypothetical protein